MNNNVSHNNRATGYIQLFQFVLLVIVVLYFGKALFVPLFFGLLIAIILYPSCKWLEKHGFNRTLSITISLLIVSIVFVVLIAILFLQLVEFKKEFPRLLARLQPEITAFGVWIEANFGMSIRSQNDWAQNAIRNLTVNSAGLLRSTVSLTISTFLTLFLVPIYAALFLYNRSAFVLLIKSLAGTSLQAKLVPILHDSVHTYFGFIKGTIIVYIIVGILNSIGLIALGINHAILFGMLTAVMTIIPFVGIIISALLPISVAWLTKDSIWYPIGVVFVFTFVQYLEANVIFPKVVAAQLKVSTWATLVAVIAGGLIWGVAGMMLFVPFVGILKVLSDNIPEWKPLNILLSR